MTIDEHDGKPVTLGAYANDVIAKLSGIGSRAYLRKIRPGGKVNEVQFEEYVATIDNISDEVQPPPLRDQHWAMRLKGWGELPSEPPDSFRNVFAERERFKDGDRSAPLYGLFSSKNDVKGSFPFMNVHVSIVPVRRRPFTIHEFA